MSGIANLRPYPAYSPSGVAWLGEVPAHWNALPLKRIGSFSSGSGFPIALQGNIEGELLFTKVSDMNMIGNEREIASTANTVSREVARNLGAKVFGINTIIFPKVGGALLTNKRRLIVRSTCIDNNLMACAVTGAKADFAFYLLGWLDLAIMAKPGPVPAISEGEVREIRIVLPPGTEQTAIVHFLDHAERRIRRSIRAKQKLIALLEEQKQAIIHQAVTGRIDVRTGRPYLSYKPSGLQWLGDVPGHWEVAAAKWYFREVDDRSQTGSEELMSVSHITGVTPRSEKNVTMFKAESNVGYKLCSPGDVVINTMWAWMAALGIARQTGIVSPSYAVYRPHCSSRLQGDYADLLLRTSVYKSEYICRSTGIRSSRLRLYPEDFLSMKVLCPPPDEQDCIVEFVSSQSIMVQRSIHGARRQITLLREYRTRLIADVVTGKLDVREAAGRLHEVNPLAGEHIGDTAHREAGSNLEEDEATQEVNL